MLQLQTFYPHETQLHFFIIAAYGLKCYTCTSSSSMDDCKGKQEGKDCEAAAISDPHCVKVSMEYSSIKSYIKDCFPKALCDNADTYLKACKAVSGAKCSLDCCDSNLCNDGTAPMVSVLLMVACALVALFR